MRYKDLIDTGKKRPSRSERERRRYRYNKQDDLYTPNPKELDKPLLDSTEEQTND
jgi:hypothetical protein